MNTHKCKEMPGDLYIKYSPWAGGWTIYSRRMNNAIMPYCGKHLVDIPVQMSF